MINKIISIAKGELGKCEAKGEDDKYIKWYGGFAMTVSWCAIFVSWVMSKAGVSTNVVPKYASCDDGMRWFKDHGLFQKGEAYGGNYIPEPGDIVFYSSKFNVNDSDHTGIVVKATSDRVYTIEGNTSDAVMEKTTLLETKRILGYGTPKYTDDFSKWLSAVQKALGVVVDGKSITKALAATPTLKRGSKGAIVKLLQERIGAEVDGDFGEETEQKVKLYQKQKVKMTKPDGIVDAGEKTWKTLLTN